MLPSTRFTEFRATSTSPPAITDPSNLQITSTTTSQISLSWTNGDPTKDIEVFEDGVYYDTVAAGGTTYNRTGLSANVTHSYKVRHVDGVDHSDFSGTGSGTTKPNAPTGLVVTPLNSSQIKLDWTPSHSLDVHVYVGGVYLTTVTAGINTFTHSSLSPSTMYSYDIYHINAGGLSAAASGSATTYAVGPLGPPTDLAGENTEEGTVVLTWTSADPTAETRVYKNGSLYATVGTGITTASVTLLIAGTSYTFEVRHYKNSIESTGNPSISHETMSISSNSLTGNNASDLFQWAWLANGNSPTGMYGVISWTDDLANTGGATINPTDAVTSHNLDVTPYGYNVASGGTSPCHVSYTIYLKHSSGATLCSKSGTGTINVYYSA